MLPMAKKPFMVRLDDELIRKLSSSARKYRRRSGNEVASEVIEAYLEFWEAAEDGKIAIVEQQRTILSERGASTRAKAKGPGKLTQSS